MLIPKKYEQCEKNPHLFIVAGDYEAKFLIAHKGEIQQKDHIQFSMREGGKEKQIYRSSNPAPEKSGAVSHFGKYQQDLKRKFYRSLRETVRDLVKKFHVEKIILFAPQQSIKNIYNEIDRDDRDIVKEKFNGTYTKKDPIEILEIWNQKCSSNVGAVPISEEEKNILNKPSI
jgi:stalled ribosome rescue protein Dom34